VDTVLAAARADTRFGRRNYAMTILLARFGLRALEVIAIQPIAPSQPRQFALVSALRVEC